jgi:glycosyltransferase involved in cell wall biosynthesis
MAAGTPVVSTTVGAEGLDVADGETIAIADSPGAFALRCLELVEDEAARQKMRSQAMELVTSRYSWQQVARRFEQLLVPAAALPELR